jgi:hypothetical protein
MRALTLGVAAVMLAAPSAASAVTRTVDYGRPGAAEMPAVRGWWNPDGGTLRIPSRHVSPTTQSQQAQTICLELTLFRFTAEFYEQPWAFDESRRRCVRTTPQRRARFPAWRNSVLAYSSYHLNVEITWRVTGGSRLSSALYDYDLVSDYRCQTKNCASAIRYLRVGSIRFES